MGAPAFVACGSLAEGTRMTAGVWAGVLYGEARAAARQVDPDGLDASSPGAARLRRARCRAPAEVAIA